MWPRQCLGEDPGGGLGSGPPMTALHNYTLETERSRFLCQSSKCTVEKIMASFYLCAIVMSLFINWGGGSGGGEEG